MKATDYQSLNQATDYHLLRFKGGLRIVAEDEAQIVHERLSQKIKDSICLDVGTGTGRVTTELLRYTPQKIYALDSSEAMLKVFQQIFANPIAKKIVKTILATSNKIPLPDKSIDVVTSFHLFKHLPEVNATLKEINRVLKPKGYLLFDVLNESSVITYNLGTCVAIKESEIIKKLKESGFDIIKIDYLHPFGETVYNLSYLGVDHFISYLDKIFSSFVPKKGTKIFILVQKK